MGKYGLSSGEVARALGVDKKTVANWLKDERLRPFFSASALRKDGFLTATFTTEDFEVLNTIRALTAEMPNNAKDWDSVAAKLAAGYRHDQYPPEAILVRPVIEPHAAMMKAQQTVMERDNALAALESMKHQYELQLADKEKQLAELRAKIAEIEANAAAEKERLLMMVGNIKQEKGMLMGMLKSLGIDPETGKPTTPNE